MANKVIQVSLKELKADFYVRKQLHDDHVLQLALLYESGVPIPPLTIGWDKQVIDGRHRKAALEFLGRQTADCMIHGQRGIAESIVIALKANVGGALPPTKEDIVHSMILLLNQGWTERRILDNMPFPRTVARKYIKDAWGVVLDAKLKSAMKAIAEDGMTAKAASEKFGVPIEKLQEHLNPNRRKRQQQSIAWKKQKLSRSFQGFHRKVAYEIKAIFDAFEDHQISEAEVVEMFDGIYELFRKGEKRVDEHMERFKILVKDTANLSKVELRGSTVKEMQELSK